MTPPHRELPPRLSPHIWQLDAAAHLLATLDERYATLRAALRVPLQQRTALLAQLDAADNELSMARAGFLDAVCQLQVERGTPLNSLAPHEYMFDALDVLWDFELAWENALESEPDDERDLEEEKTVTNTKD